MPDLSSIQPILDHYSNIPITTLLRTFALGYGATFTAFHLSAIKQLKQKKINLQKISQYENYIMEEHPELNPWTRIRTMEEAKKQIDMTSKSVMCLLPLLEKLKQHTTEENLKLAYSNLITAVVQKRKYLKNCSGSYSPIENKIKYTEDSTLSHEFLHLASSDFHICNIYSGFVQADKKSGLEIGRGLDEGYTELLASRIYHKTITSYFREIKLAQLFELFFEHPKDMENYYFTCNLPGLIRYMEQFAPRQEIISTLFDIDQINRLQSKIPYIILSPFISYYEIKVKLTLYKWFKKSNHDRKRLRQFQKRMCENKTLSLLLGQTKLKLYKENPYILSNGVNEQEHHKQKIKSTIK